MSLWNWWEKIAGTVDVHRTMLSSTAKVNPDLALEREKASFNPIELSHLLHGGRQKIERKRYLGTVIYVISFLGYFAKTCNVNSSFRKVKHARSL